jgi:hypothetical protein
MLSFLLFLVIFFGMVVICSLFIVGWYGITRGEIVHNEDGSITKKGKLFKGFHFFWDRKKLVQNDSKSVPSCGDKWAYVWPEWVRYPISECTSCMASLYGSGFYWFFIWQIGYKPVYSWANHPLTACVIGWGVFCIAVSCMNPIIYKKTI